MSQNFVHLHVHSAYSLLDGAIRVPELVGTAASMGMPAVALTDHGQMFGALAFYNAAKKAGIKPIVGVEAYLTVLGRKTKEKDDPRCHLVLLAMNLEGYRNLCRMISLANLEGFYYKPRVDHELLERYGEGLIALSGCLQGEIPRLITARDYAGARRAIERYAGIFPDRFYLELQENRIPEQDIVNRALIDFGKEMGLPVVATNDCHYLREEHYTSHDVLLCIQTKTTVQTEKRMRMPFNTYWFRSAEEMRELFAYCPEACDNTLAIAERCSLEFPERTYHFPNLRLPEGTTAEARLEGLAREGLSGFFAKREARGEPFSDADKARYAERLEMELGVISRMGFAGYFVIVQDFTSWARSRGIPVGPGRGSAAGSLVSFALGITSIDPLRFDLLFERFLNPERVSMPDIDTDFCTEGRAEVLEYVTATYGGSEYVSQIATLGQMKARAVIRDCARALGMPLSQADSLAKLVPDDDLNITLDLALERVPRLAELHASREDVRELFHHARNLEKLFRHVSLHASGVVIGDRPLMEHLPLMTIEQKQTKNVSVATQFEYNGVEQMGLIKFDFLGLQTLTLIKHCLRLLSEKGINLDMDALDTSDPKTYELFRSGNLNGVFQMEKSGFRPYIMNLRPKRLDDIIHLLALYRPGPLKGGQAEQFIRVKRGMAAPEYLHPRLVPLLEDTAGVIIYQEQVMLICQLLAGFSLGEADVIRRAMGKKKPEEMNRIRPDFIARCVANGVDAASANSIFDALEKFAEYGFNKSHSAAYAVVSFQTAYLKAHHPVEFMAALMTSEQNDRDKIAELMDDCRASGLEVLPPDVNSSGEKFTVKDGKILFGLGAIKDLGQGAIEAICEEREKRPYSDLFDFCARLHGKKINRRYVEALIKSGALDTAGGADRGTMLASLENAMKEAAEKALAAESRFRQNSLFGAPAGASSGPAWVEAPPLPEAVRLSAEKEFLGFYVTGHPQSRYEHAARALRARRVSQVLAGKRKEKVRVCGTLSSVKVKKDRRGNDFAFATLEDMTSKIELLVWSSAYQKVKDILGETRLVVVEGHSEPQSEDSRYGAAKITVDDVWVLEDKLDSKVKSVVVAVQVSRLREFMDYLDESVAPASGPAGPRFFFKILDGSGGEAMYRPAASPPLTLSLLEGGARILGGDAFSFSDLANPFGPSGVLY
ncbi:MAG: DNA polymerase III subunit alpha [Deltaproteobacteria bacterium]|jgi:DNA polymerase-3 subunit alpha|nr:DNA polymerase III subunit alpha [Deltaproteobacteria bacterium]